MTKDQFAGRIRSKSLSGAQILILIVLSIVVAAITALGCSWPGTSHSVRFNGYQTEREMGRLPPLPTMANGMNEGRLYWDEGDFPDPDYNQEDETEDESKSIEGLWNRAHSAEKDGNLRLDRELLTEYLKKTGGPRDAWVESAGDRNSAIDRIDALTALDHGSTTVAVSAYLDARRIYDSKDRKHSDVEQALAQIPADKNLRDNVAYLAAAEQYQEKHLEEAAEAFRDLARRYPRGEKREAALFMAAVATMKTSRTYIPASGNSDYGESFEASTDQAWADAFAAFQKTINEYPHGRYANDARGWQAYLFLRRSDRAAALVQYYRLLADASETARTDAAFSLMLVRSSATDDEMSRVETALANEPKTALAYAYHNIYNYSIDPGAESPEYEDVEDSSGTYDYEANRKRQEQVEQEWQRDRERTDARNLLALWNFQSA